MNPKIFCIICQIWYFPGNSFRAIDVLDVIKFYINDIRFGVLSNLTLYADDCILYQVIKCDHDHN